MSTATTVWLTARGAGLSSLVLLTASTSLGALTSLKAKPATRVVWQYVHRVAATLGLGVLVLHIATILADSYAHVGVTGALIPFTAGYRATWVGLGTIAAYTFVLIAALGFARGRLAASAAGARTWRAVHALAYGGWAVAMVHGMMSGTDTSISWVRTLYLVCAAAVGGALTVRLSAGHRRADLVRGAQPAMVKAVAR